MQAGRADAIATICLGLAAGAAAQSHDYVQVGELRATADIVEYDGRPRVKVGREFLLRNGRNARARPKKNGGA